MFGAACGPNAHDVDGGSPPGMRWIPGGEFTVGSDDPRSRDDERPAHRARIDGFWMDAHPVTNAEYARFVAATGYVTTAERKPDWEELRRQLPPGTPRPPDDVLVSGSLVFVPPPGPVPLEDLSRWWQWVPGADWRHPEGPTSNVAEREDHPVVQVSWGDAMAYAAWSGERLPTEAEWERAALGGIDRRRFPWGDTFQPGGRHMANTFQGPFPWRAVPEDGFAGTSPVGAFPANPYGLYDIAGNVWQWTSDWYRYDAYAHLDGIAVNPRGPASSWDPAEPTTPKRVIKGGSYLCNASYCESYRPSARRGAAADTGTTHVGFRCVRDPVDVRSDWPG